MGWRNNLAAHRDLKLAVEAGAELRSFGSRKDVQDILFYIEGILNVVSEYYLKSTLSVRLPSYSGADDLLRVLRLGQMMNERRKAQIERGEMPDGGLPLPPI